MFGPSQDQSDGSVSLFAVKPKEAATSSDAQNAAPKDGSSASLQYLSQANTAPKEPEQKPAEAPKDAGAASAATSADAAAATAGGSSGPLNASGSTGNGVSKGLLKTGGKFGELSKSFGGGGGGAVAGGAPAKGGSAADAAAQAGGSHGAATGMKKGVAAMGGGSRAVASRKGANSGMRQAMSALADNRGATTSYGAGRTYDGSAPTNTGNIGPTGGEIGMGGQGDTTGAQPTSTPNTANQTKEFKAPPEPDAVMAAPWQKAIDTAKIMVGIAVALLLIAKLAAKTQYGRLVTMVVAAIVAVLGAMVIALGAQIGGGEYGQKAQGAWLAAAGVGLCIAAAAAAFGGGDNSNSSGMNTDGSVASAGADEAKDAGFFAGVNTWVLIGGGLGLAGMIGSMMTPPQKYPSKQFENGHPPDINFFGYQAPSEAAVKRMVA
ncbi:MAG: hypothetical protein HY079_13270 [Elusimicrobia bacterium]|nr:hypothetical protein [Elusimicrobiota bacterium]